MTDRPMKWAFGIQAQVVLAIILVFSTVLGTMALLLYRQNLMREQVAMVTRDAMQGAIVQQLQDRAHDRVVQMADSLTNPFYYFDLESIGKLSESVKGEADVTYVLVYDDKGNIVHDGSGEIAAYGRKMDDPLATAAITAKGPLVQRTPSVMDAAMPIELGEDRLGGVRIGYSLQNANRAVARATASLDEQVETLAARDRNAIALLIAIIPLVALAMAWYMQRRFVRPVMQLAQHAQAMESGRYDVAIAESRRRDEVGALERAFARMSRSVRDHDSQIREIAFTDALTGLPNRRSFLERLDARLMNEDTDGGIALLFIDVDDFKRVNDTMGHEAGDRVLIELSDRFRSAADAMPLRSSEVARLGGDEFVIVIQAREGGPRALSAVASQLAEAMVDAAARPVELADGQRVFLGASIGITLFPGDAVGAVTLIKNGDIAMYQAKTAGKHCYRFYHPSMEQVVERRVRMEHELRTAWERGELTLVYQPVYRLSDRRVLGAEALLRWQHPEYGLVAPSVFIGVAEESGLIEQIGSQVMRAACQDAAHWHLRDDGDEPFFVSVNLSARQLRDEWLPSEVGRILAETGLAPGRLHVELTETAVLDPDVANGPLLDRLREIGVRIWLDDFGTGFSGLNHLRTLTVDGVKIDRSFVADILQDEDDLALTRAVIGMARSLGVVVVAEGIEELGQYELLRDAGCELGQGYWLGQPMVNEDFIRLIED